MNLEINNETIRLCEVISKEKRNKLIEGDMIVPDIKPDILSVSNIDADIFLTKKEVSSGKLLIEGVADVTAIYVAEDQNGSIKSLNNVFNFNESIDIENLADESIVNVKVNRELLEYKVMNGRKISIKIPINLDVIVRNCTEYMLAKDVVDDRNIEIQKQEIEVQTIINSEIQNVELNEVITLPEEKESIAEILKAKLEIKNVDYKTSYNKILAKADAVIKIIYVSDADIPSIETYEASVPVMGYINSDNLDENSKIELAVDIKSFALRPIYQDLKSRSFSIESEIEIRANVSQNKKIEIISDIYDPDSNLISQTQSLTLINNVLDANEDIEIVQGLMIPELENIKILSIDAKPTISNKNVLDGKLAIEGNVEFNILYYNIQKRMIENKKVELPYQQVLKVPELKSEIPIVTKIKVKEIEYRNADSSQLQLKLILNVNMYFDEKRIIQGITQIEKEELLENNNPSLIVYYVKPHDTLWAIAKKYRSTIAEIKEYNFLKDDVIYPNQQLIIPKRSRRVLSEII